MSGGADSAKQPCSMKNSAEAAAFFLNSNPTKPLPPLQDVVQPPLLICRPCLYILEAAISTHSK